MRGILYGKAYKVFMFNIYTEENEMKNKKKERPVRNLSWWF